jgi:hypothetical protein
VRKELAASEAAAAAITDDSRRLAELVAKAQALLAGPAGASGGGAAGAGATEGAELFKQSLQLLASLRQRLYDRVGCQAVCTVHLLLLLLLLVGLQHYLCKSGAADPDLTCMCRYPAALEVHSNASSMPATDRFWCACVYACRQTRCG